MASNCGLNFPEHMTPTKIAISSDNILFSPSAVQSRGDESSGMIATGGVPIAMLRTPTKVSSHYNIAPKQRIASSPSKVFTIKVPEILTGNGDCF